MIRQAKEFFWIPALWRERYGAGYAGREWRKQGCPAVGKVCCSRWPHGAGDWPCWSRPRPYYWGQVRKVLRWNKEVSRQYRWDYTTVILSNESHLFISRKISKLFITFSQYIPGCSCENNIKSHNPCLLYGFLDFCNVTPQILNDTLEMTEIRHRTSRRRPHLLAIRRQTTGIIKETLYKSHVCCWCIGSYMEFGEEIKGILTVSI